MRIVVVEPPPEGAPRLDRSPIAVGAFDWFDPDPMITVVVKRTYRFTGGLLVLAPEQRELTRANDPRFEEDPSLELHDPWDFAP